MKAPKPVQKLSPKAIGFLKKATDEFRSIGAYAMANYKAMTRYVMSGGTTREEIESICWLEVVKRAEGFNEKRSKVKTFVHMIIRSALKRQIESMNALKRKCPTTMFSIDTHQDYRGHYDCNNNFRKLKGVFRGADKLGICKNERTGSAEQRHDDESESNVKAVECLTKCLQGSQILVIRLRYPMDGSKPMSTREVAKAIGLSVMAVNYAERAALERMRNLADRHPEILNNIFPA